ncbi:Peptidoglycan-N-acetylglucosamine deacetylase [Tolypocladium capitatum]|uniref:Peptidoglycan-N-acetylglucosamine deacetylase n=1 Tax=Tolypocladium capitatum TaxID=45235 RepID=A0A2K3QMF9_9HYPO|nr:Peptidoglycan-N-acetylglucosamine deacetylase [Tolypocladium capitatum]
MHTYAIILAASAGYMYTAAHDARPGVPRFMAGRAPAGRLHMPDFRFARREGPQVAPSLDVTSRQVSADGRCGVEFGTSCEAGDCCSKGGWCGQGYVYCSSPACQIDYCDSCDGNVRPSGRDTEDVPRPQVGPVPYGQGVYHCEVDGVIALSFDDGPFTYTEDLLNLLSRYDAKATFFVTGRNLGKGAINDDGLPWAALIRRMVRDGHQVASHTWSHQRLTELTYPKFLNQMLFNEIALADVLGYFPTYMRPPYSASSAQTDGWLGELGYHVTYFNLDTEGYLHDSPATIQRSKDIWDEAVEGHDPQSTKWLQIEHDTVDQAVHNLTEHILGSLFRNGFRSVTVGECLGDPRENWYRALDGAAGESTGRLRGSLPVFGEAA